MNGSVHNHELARLLLRRKVRIQELGKLLPGGMGRTHVSLTLNGVRPIRTPNDVAVPRPLTKTWRLLREVLTAEEFAVALAFANARRAEMGLPVLGDKALTGGPT